MRGKKMRQEKISVDRAEKAGMKWLALLAFCFASLVTLSFEKKEIKFLSCFFFFFACLEAFLYILVTSPPPACSFYVKEKKS